MKDKLKKSGLVIKTLLNTLYRRIRQDPKGSDPDEIDMIIVTGEGVIVNDTYIDKERIETIVDEVLKAEIQRGIRTSDNSGESTFRLPELGVVVRQKGGVIKIGGIEIQRKSWLYKEISRLFLQHSKR